MRILRENELTLGVDRDEPLEPVGSRARTAGSLFDAADKVGADGARGKTGGVDGHDEAHPPPAAGPCRRTETPDHLGEYILVDYVRNKKKNVAGQV